MNRITRHVPNFVDIDGANKQNSFETTEELLNIPWVKSNEKYKHFSRWEISKDCELMAVYHNGKEWWVVGFIEKPHEIKLPIWKPVYGKKGKKYCPLCDKKKENEAYMTCLKCSAE